MNSYLTKFDSLINDITEYFQIIIAPEGKSYYSLIKYHCLITLNILVVLATVLAVIMLINSECSEQNLGCLLTKVTKQVYKLVFTTICPQTALVIFFSFAAKKIQGNVPLKFIVSNALILAFLNIFSITAIIYIANFTELSYQKLIVATVFICPIISYIVSDTVLRKINNKNDNLNQKVKHTIRSG